MVRSKTIELTGELKRIFSGDRNIIDSIIPPLIFVIINATIGFDAAMLSALVVAISLGVVRLIRRQTIFSALAGVAGVVVAIIMAKYSGRNEGFFLPNIVANQLWILAILASLIIGKPLIAVGSYFLRQWPLGWYWHPQVKPAYMEVSFMWLVILGVRSALQISFYLNQAVDELAIMSLVSGAPLTLTLLAISYFYGSWRLEQLKGPSVIEFQDRTPYPWNGQNPGF